MTEKPVTKLFRSRCEFSVSLRFELFDAIQILLNPDTRIHKNWRDNAISALPKEFHENVKLLGNASELWPTLSSLLPRDRSILTFEEIISILEKFDEKSLQLRVITSLIHDEKLARKLTKKSCTLKKAIKDAPALKREWLEFVGLFPYREDTPLILALEALLEHPEVFKKRIISVLTSFWKTVFRETWYSLENQYQQSARKKEQAFHVCSFEEFSQRALLRVHVDEDRDELRAMRGGYRLQLKRVGRCVFMPSAFNDRRYWSALEEGKNDNNVCVYFPYFDPEISLDFSQTSNTSVLEEPEMEIALIMKALGDTTRFAIAALTAKTPLSSVEIAKSLDISKPTVSHHISILRGAGLIEDTHFNGRTRIRLRRKTIEALTELSITRFYHHQSTSGQ